MSRATAILAPIIFALLIAAALYLAVQAYASEVLAVPRGLAAPLQEEQDHATTPTDVWLPAGHVTILIHGVNDDGKGWSLRFKDVLTEVQPWEHSPEVHLLRWTQPDGGVPALAHARNSVDGIEKKYPSHPASEAAYQTGVAMRLRDFLVKARGLYTEYGVDGKIDLVGHSQGTLIALKALDLGAEADNVVFLGSPLIYAGDRQDDVVQALPHVRGVVYNYYTRSDIAIRLMGGGLLFREPCGWPAQGLPATKVVQTCLKVEGHTGYYTAEAIRANYLDKLEIGASEGCRMDAGRAREFTYRWNELVRTTGLVDPE